MTTLNKVLQFTCLKLHFEGTEKFAPVATSAGFELRSANSVLCGRYGNPIVFTQSVTANAWITNNLARLAKDGLTAQGFIVSLAELLIERPQDTFLQAEIDTIEARNAGDWNVYFADELTEFFSVGFKGEKGATGLQGVQGAKGYAQGGYSIKTMKTPYFENNVSGKKVDILISNNWYFAGCIKVSVTGFYSYAPAFGKLAKMFSLGFSYAGDIYENISANQEQIGSIVNNMSIGDFSWDATKQKYKIPLNHIASQGNDFTVMIEAFGHIWDMETFLNGVTLSEIY